MSYSPQDINYNRGALGNYMSNYATNAGMGIQRVAGIGKKSCERGFSLTKIFFILMVICTIAYVSLQIQKTKFDKKYSIALLVILIFALVGGGVVLKIGDFLNASPQTRILKYILQFIFVFGPIVTFLILNALLGANKF
jgi:hypothetical protein